MTVAPQLVMLMSDRCLLLAQWPLSCSCPPSLHHAHYEACATCCTEQKCMCYCVVTVKVDKTSDMFPIGPTVAFVNFSAVALYVAFWHLFSFCSLAVCKLFSTVITQPLTHE